jgi:predicted nucleotidyltransferase
MRGEIMQNINAVPELYQQNLQKAIRILKNSGCTEIFVFGSLATNNVSQHSDIDLAVRGCPKGKFFQVLGKLLVELDVSVDLVNLESRDPFANYLT